MPGEMLSAMLDEELRGSQRQWVAEHAAGCDDCALQLGRLIAAKEAVRRDDPVLGEVPMGLFERLRGEFDRVDEVARAADMRCRRSRSRLVPALVAVGILLAATAVGIRIHSASEVVSPSLFIRAHEAVGSGALLSDDRQTTYNAVSVGSTYAPWHPVWESLLTERRTVIRQTVSLAGRLPVSTFVVPDRFFDTSKMQAAYQLPDGVTVWVGEYVGGSVAAAAYGEWWEVWVARTSPEHLAALACSQLVSAGY
jgi:hypothetical protein